VNTIGFRNIVQVTLWNKELCGQISDGFWENSRPYGHWQGITGATADLGKLGPQGFRPRRSYNFANKELLECVGDRMLEYVRALEGYENFTMKELKRELRDMNSIVNADAIAHRKWLNSWKKKK
jgi:hypothetical protein